jgi:hypothetical protein
MSLSRNRTLLDVFELSEEDIKMVLWHPNFLDKKLSNQLTTARTKDVLATVTKVIGMLSPLGVQNQ